MIKDSRNSLYKRKIKYEKKIKSIEYKGGCCSRCGIKSSHICIYDFHHTDSNEKDFNISKILTNNWENIKKELDKCILLCANCHRIVHQINTSKKDASLTNVFFDSIDPLTSFPKVNK